ncbi:MAG: radical SAM protein, partial [Deltaproteobacteria bacterium]
GKFQHPDITAKGEPRAFVPLERLETLWFNTGTLCNLACRNCYIESTPTNDRLVYLTCDEVATYLDEIEAKALGTRQIGFTGGEPFMNPEIVAILRSALERGFEVLVLTNAMRPMQKKREDLLELRDRFGKRLTLRVSIDHYTPECHEKERGPRSWAPMIEGVRWLAEKGFSLSVAGRTCWDEPEEKLRAGFATLFRALGLSIDPCDPTRLVLFPEMDEGAEVPEITTKCWEILGIDPRSVMCATSRMVVKRKGTPHPVVLSCTLLPYDERFEMGRTLEEAAGVVKLNHPHCAKFCVLGGGSCSAAR